MTLAVKFLAGALIFSVLTPILVILDQKLFPACPETRPSRIMETLMLVSLFGIPVCLAGAAIALIFT